MDGFKQRVVDLGHPHGPRIDVNLPIFNELAVWNAGCICHRAGGGNENEKASSYRGFRGCAVGSGGECCRRLRTVWAAASGSRSGGGSAESAARVGARVSPMDQGSL